MKNQSMKNPSMKNQTWVLVANSSQARLFSLENLKTLHEVNDFVHPEGRLHDRDIIDQKPGRTNDSTSPHRHAIEPKTSQKELALEQFARSISNYLEKEYRASAFSKLFIAAGPAFLGMLRKELKPDVAQAVQKEVPKDIVRLSTSQILETILE
jgi:protein required for attachment to host cells